MYEHLSQRCQKVLKLANVAAREYDQEYVGTEHVLLAVIREGTGIGARVLVDRGLHEDKIKEAIDLLVKKSMEDTWVFGRLPGSPHFKNVIARAVEEAQLLESKEVCTEHLILGLLREQGSVAYNALIDLGVEYDSLREEAIQLRKNGQSTPS